MRLKTVGLTTVLLCLLLYALPLPAQQKAAGDSCFSTLLAAPGVCKSRFMGDLEIRYQIDTIKTVITCVLLLNTQLAGACRLTPDNDTYDFDMELGSGKAKGSFKLIPASPCNINNLNGNFTYTVTGNNVSLIFKGSLVAWYSKCVSTPITSKR
jgi:hypothetical protein